MFLLAVITTSFLVPVEPAKALDFWVGEWTCSGPSLTDPAKKTYSPTKGENSIKKILRGKVIEERFSMKGFKGLSYSVYIPREKKWRQTWVDDQGSYIDLEGGQEGDTVVLTTLPREGAPQSRMVFSNITPNSFKWVWETKQKDGTWLNYWTLDYKRKS